MRVLNSGFRAIRVVVNTLGGTLLSASASRLYWELASKHRFTPSDGNITVQCLRSERFRTRMNTSTVNVVWPLLAIALLLPTSSLGKTPEQACAAGKQKAAGTFAKKAFTCFAKAAAKGVTVDPSCQSKAEEKFRAALAKLEEKGGCVTSGDADSLLDYLKFVVRNLAANLPTAPEECTNDIDDNGNGHIDCDDVTCSSGAECVELGCSDGVDSDGDGAADCADVDCLDDLACIETVCSDGVDNDGDQNTDCSDVDCFDDLLCNTCGNGVPEGLESCDGTDLRGQTCESLGFASGTLTCFPFCALDTSPCVLGPPPSCIP